MTDIEQALAWEKERNDGATFYEGMPINNFLCMAILAAEVRRLREENEAKDVFVEGANELIEAAEKERDEFRNKLEQLIFRATCNQTEDQLTISELRARLKELEGEVEALHKDGLAIYAMIGVTEMKIRCKDNCKLCGEPHNEIYLAKDTPAEIGPLCETCTNSILYPPLQKGVTDMNCTRCGEKIAKGQKFHRTQKGAHHAGCSNHNTLLHLLHPPTPEEGAAVWEIDMSTGTPILVYAKCSVIQDEQAYLVLEALNYYWGNRIEISGEATTLTASGERPMTTFKPLSKNICVESTPDLTQKIMITINGQTILFDLSESSFLEYDEICRLAGYDPKQSPSVVCRSTFRKERIIYKNEIGPLENGAVYTVVVTGDA